MPKRKLKIALGATLHKKVRRSSTGGTEIFIYLLSQELKKRGHKVTMFASGDSRIKTKLYPISNEKEINRFEQKQRLFYAYQLWESQLITLHQKEFDVIHINYFEPFLFTPFSQLIKKPVVYSVHSDIFVSPAWQKVTNKMVKKEDKFIFVSKNAYQKAPFLKNKTFIYNGIDISAFSFSNRHQNYLLWLGRIRKKKGIKEAVEVAVKSGEKLIISGVIDNPQEKLLFEQEVLPVIKKNKNIKFIGPASFDKKVKLYQNAKAFLFPISWEEPFGLTMIEALSCGTPVLAFNRGAVNEIVKNGETGFIVNNTMEMVKKLKQIDQINRLNCRKSVKQKFSIQKMVDSYEKLYLSL